MARPKRIDEIQRIEGEFYVYLMPGWKLKDAGQGPQNEAHSFGAFKRTDITREMKRVVRCRCGECKRLIAESANQ